MSLTVEDITRPVHETLETVRKGGEDVRRLLEEGQEHLRSMEGAIDDTIASLDWIWEEVRRVTGFRIVPTPVPFGFPQPGDDEEEDAAPPQELVLQPPPPAEVDDWLYLTTPLDGARREFVLKNVIGKEALSEPYHYRLQLKTRQESLDFATMMGKAVTVHIVQHNGEIRYINGIVSAFSQGDFDGEIATYHAQIRPWLWQLTLTRNSRIFQQQTALEIITKVFQDLGFTDFKDSTSGMHAQREYCVQYQESDFNFISRLMEEEGIFYFFEHSKEKHILVLADDGGAHSDCPGQDTARLREYDPEDDSLIESCSFVQQLGPHRYDTTDFAFETPDTALLTGVDAAQTGSLAVFDYPGGFTTTSDGERIAGWRIEALEAPGKLLKGKGYCRAFIAGYKFKLIEHFREDMNGAYLLKTLLIKADQEKYTNQFEAIPAATPFRPLPTTPKPRIYGTQTAIVTGKQGEEIWPDRYGRVKVQFHWDRQGTKDDQSSCWIRVGQVWAGKGWGTVFIPRMGAEVIVSFLEGDPDQPIIIGTVYNARQTTPYTLPDDKNKSGIRTRSTKDGQAGNEICFDDTKDAENLLVQAQKDHTINVANDRKTTVDHDDTLTVKNSRSVTILEKDDQLIVKQGKREIAVQAGNETHTNKGNYTQTVSGNFTLQVDGNLTIEAKGIVTIKGAMIKLN